MNKVDSDLTLCKEMPYDKWAKKYEPVGELLSWNEFLEKDPKDVDIDFVWTVMEYDDDFTFSSNIFVFSSQIVGYQITKKPKKGKWVLGILKKEKE